MLLGWVVVSYFFEFENKAEVERVLHRGFNALRKIFCAWKGGVQRWGAFEKMHMPRKLGLGWWVCLCTLGARRCL